MSGSAVLDPTNLVDSLVPVVDGLRGELHPQFGVRPYRAFTVRRTWSGSQVGVGTPSDVLTEIVPQPEVAYRTRYEQTPAGRREVGETVITEVSLTYTYAELEGGGVAANEQWFIMLREAHGQGNPDLYYVLAAPPTVDREEDIGWRLVLRKAVVSGCSP